MSRNARIGNVADPRLLLARGDGWRRPTHKKPVTPSHAQRRCLSTAAFPSAQQPGA